MAVRPQKTLLTSLTITEYLSFWEEDTGDGDAFIGLPWRWKVSLSVTPATHSNAATRVPFSYDGEDIKVGDWIAGFSPNGAAVVITEIVSADYATVECIVEDYERYNAMNDPAISGNGLSDTGTGFVFEIGPEGQPLVSSLPDFYGSLNIISGLNARFATRNPYCETVSVHQTNHGLNIGDIIRPDTENAGRFVPALADRKIKEAVGIVTDINIPGMSYFTYRPLGRLVNNVEPPLVGEHGELFYVDPTNPGKLTNIRPMNNARAIYMRLDLPTRGLLLNQPTEDYNETRKYDIEDVEDDQTEFTLPDDAEEVMYMAINGIENKNFTFVFETKTVTFDPEATGYGVDSSDEVFFVYKS